MKAEVGKDGIYIPFIGDWVKLSKGKEELLQKIKLEDLILPDKIKKFAIERLKINSFAELILIDRRLLNRIQNLKRNTVEYTNRYIKKCLLEIENGVYQENKSLYVIIDGIMSLANDKTREILLTRWSESGINSYKEVGNKTGLSIEGIRQIVNRRLATLKAEFDFYLLDFLSKIREYLEENFKRVVIDEFIVSEKEKSMYDPKLYFGIICEIYPFIPIEGFKVNYLQSKLMNRNNTYQTLNQMYDELMKMKFVSHGLFIEQIYEQLNITSDEDKIKLFYILLESNGFIFDKDSNNRTTIRRKEELHSLAEPIFSEAEKPMNIRQLIYKIQTKFNEQS